MQGSTSAQGAIGTHAGTLVHESVNTASLAVAFALGLALVFLTGFSHLDVVHNAAHDTRHSLAFPCH